MQIKLLLACLIGVVIMFGMDYFRHGKDYAFGSRVKYALAFVVLAVISYFLKHEVVQQLLLVLAGIGTTRLFTGLNKVAKNDPIAYGRGIAGSDKWDAGQWMAFTAIFAFASVGSFFQINSYWADQNHFNGLFGWLGIGIVTGLIAAFGLYKMSVTGSGGGGSSVQ